MQKVASAHRDSDPQQETEQSSEAQNAAPLSSPARIHRAILEGLYQGRYVPGQKLIEADLVRDFRASRGSVREALNQLAAAGVISLTRHQGAYIRSLTRSEASEVLSILEVIIGFAARLGAERIESRTSNVALLGSCLERLSGSQARFDYLAFVKARNEFYRTLVNIGGNRELARILPTMQVHLLRIQFRSYLTRFDDIRDDYQRITQAVLRGDVRRSEWEARRHIRRVKQSIVSLPDEAFARDG